MKFVVMDVKKNLKTDNLLLIFITLVLFINSCADGNRRDKKDIATFIGHADSSLLFNGENLDGWEITNFGPQGPVSVSRGEIILGMGDGCTGITWKRDFPIINYEVTLQAMKLDGNDFFCGVTFPVRKESCTLIVGGWGGTTVGLSSINNRDASENETTTLQKFDRNRWYQIRLVVTETHINAWIDGNMVVDFSSAGKRLSVRPEVELSRPFGITTWMTAAAIRNIRVIRTGR